MPKLNRAQTTEIHPEPVPFKPVNFVLVSRTFTAPTVRIPRESLQTLVYGNRELEALDPPTVREDPIFELDFGEPTRDFDCVALAREHERLLENRRRFDRLAREYEARMAMIGGVK